MEQRLRTEHELVLIRDGLTQKNGEMPVNVGDFAEHNAG